MVQHFFRPFLAFVLALITSFTAGAEAPTGWRYTELTDAEGFQRPLTAYRLLVPKEWKIDGRIAWRKPCTALPLYETLYRVTSPNERVGLRLAPSHSITWQSHSAGTNLPPDLARLFQARMEADQQRLREKFRGSNCRFGWLNDPKELLGKIILPARSAATRVVSIKKDEERVKSLASIIKSSMLPGAKYHYGAVEIRLVYPSSAGEIEEDVIVAWQTVLMQNQDPQLGGSTFQNTILYPVLSMWAPVGKLDRYKPLLSTILQSFKAEEDWLVAVNAVRERLRKQQQREFEIRQRQRKDAFDRRTADWRERQKQNERSHQRFVKDVIWGGTPDRKIKIDNYTDHDRFIHEIIREEEVVFVIVK